jgi:hypothetical protein
MVCQWFDLKTTGTVFSGLTSKPVAIAFSDLASKPLVMVFSDLASKLVAMVSPNLGSKSVVCFLVDAQNQGGGGVFGLDLKIDSYDFMI